MPARRQTKTPKENLRRSCRQLWIGCESLLIVVEAALARLVIAFAPRTVGSATFAPPRPGNFAPTLRLGSLPWIAGTGLGLLACAHLRHGSGDVAYAGQQAGIAFIMATVQGSAPSADILPAIDRLVGVAGGMAVAGAALAFLAPGLRAALARLGLRAPASCAG